MVHLGAFILHVEHAYVHVRGIYPPEGVIRLGLGGWDGDRTGGFTPQKGNSPPPHTPPHNYQSLAIALNGLSPSWPMFGA